MNQSSKTGLVVLGISLALGIAGDRLLRVGPWAGGACLWMVLLAVASAASVGFLRKSLPGGLKWLLLPFLAFSACLAWRDAASLRFLNLLGLFSVLAIVAVRSGRGQVAIGTITEYTVGLVAACFECLARFFLLFSDDVKWKDLGKDGTRSRFAAVLRGLAVAVPLLIVFGLLFASADAVFSKFVTDLFRWDIESLVVSLGMIPAFAWISGAFLRQLVIGHAFPPPKEQSQEAKKVGIIEIGIVIGALDLLFLAFVIVQFRYFFGGHQLVQSAIPLTYSQYAHKGVFELVTACGLALVVLLTSNWLLKNDTPRATSAFRGLSLAMVALIFVIIASVYQRISIYVDAYGLSVLRFWVGAVVAWLAAAFVWFVATVLRGKQERFAFGAVAISFAVVLVANGLNPEAMVVRANTGRALDRLDVRYLTGLSADAVPDLVAALPRLTDKQRAEACARLLERWPDKGFRDPRLMNASRNSARAVFGTRRDDLVAWAAAFQDQLNEERYREGTGTEPTRGVD